MWLVRVYGGLWYVSPSQSARDQWLTSELGQGRFQNEEEVECQSLRCDTEKAGNKTKGGEEESKVIAFLPALTNKCKRTLFKQASA